MLIAGRKPLSLNAQISEGGFPLSFAVPSSVLRNSIAPHRVPVDFDVDQLIKEDEESEALGLPLRCAKIIPVDLRFEQEAEWMTLPSGQRIGRMEIAAGNARTIALYYDEFVIPEGGKLFLYNPDHSKILGAYTHKTNSKQAEFATELVNGDRIVLEYEAPLAAGDGLTPRIKIGGLAYGYNHLATPAGEGLSKVRGNSGNCMININCEEGENWQNQKKGVARILTPISGDLYLCSGTVVNNTAGNLDPLFLSAHHCFEGIGSALLNQTIYYFHYEYPGCENLGTDPEAPTMVGAQILVDTNINGSSDGTLLRLNDPIPEEYGVYYNGWDRRNIPAASGAGIHHPAGDVKKISTFTSPATIATWNGSGATGAVNAHWNVLFSPTPNGYSAVEGGSSGSPLFNQEGLVVGTLTGGTSSCLNTMGVNYYGKLWYHWDQAEQQMSQYLDPIHSGQETLEGTYVDAKLSRADFSIEPEDVYANQPVRFINTSRNADTWEWTFEGGIPASSNEENPPPVIYNEAGFYTVALIVNKGTEKEHQKTVEIPVTAETDWCPAGKLTIGEGISYSQFPLGASQRHTLTSALYMKEEIGLEKGGSIRQIAWHSAASRLKAGKLSVYLKETTEEELFPSNWAILITGARLVYEGVLPAIDSTGWVNIPLPRAFLYSGTRNLKVSVRMVTEDEKGYFSSNCYYTNIPNRTLRWTDDSPNIPSRNGIANNWRPDIQLNADIPCEGNSTNSVVPVINSRIYPNPADNQLMIQSPYAIRNILVLDLQGRIIQAISGLNTGEVQLQTSEWTKGMYIIKVQTEKDSFTKTVIKQ
jgi:PKD repeat protein